MRWVRRTRTWKAGEDRCRDDAVCGPHGIIGARARPWAGPCWRQMENGGRDGKRRKGGPGTEEEEEARSDGRETATVWKGTERQRFPVYALCS